MPELPHSKAPSHPNSRRTAAGASISTCASGSTRPTALPDYRAAPPSRFGSRRVRAGRALSRLAAARLQTDGWLIQQTKPQDWEEGSRPIAWPSARRQAGISRAVLSRVKALNRALWEAGIS